MIDREIKNLHASFVKLVPAWKAHDATDAVDVLLQTDYTFALLAAVPTSPLRKTG